MPCSNNSNSGSDKSCSKSSRKCIHNNWDNVRAEKKVITLRCRECQKQQRIYTTSGSWKCQSFLTSEGCPDGESCEKYHINNRKQSLEERVHIHGMSVVNHVRLGKVVGDVHRKVDELKEKLSTNTAHSTALSAIQDMLEAPEAETTQAVSQQQQQAQQQPTTITQAALRSVPVQCVPQQMIAAQTRNIVIQTQQPQQPQQQLTPPRQFIFPVQQANIPMALASCGQQMCYQPMQVFVPAVYAPLHTQWVA